MRMHTTLVLAAVTSLTVGTGGSAAFAAPARPVPGAGVEAAPAVSCPWVTRILLSPGLTMIPQDFTFTQTGTVGPCAAADGSVASGTFTVAKGSGTGSCPSAKASAPFVVAWDDGTKSSGVAEAVTVTAVAFVTGTISEGRFAGAPFVSVVALNAAGPLNCGTSGVTSAETYGELLLGPS